ncbi:hypothetical protein JHK85_040674 [Glycine max]|uniref:Uncharacterized protein n=1 Tax=Glycine soja TaxID=3848 RepID=A0A0B2QZ06_GLYSO|nr:hypothetical protein JHK85_040674 [Glycine max]KHN25219.1 hypothetical protein glysoja_030466 [Glycine soja]
MLVASYGTSHAWLMFTEEITWRNWRQLAEPLPKYNPEVVLECYANAWPTKEGVIDQGSKV